MNTQCGIKTFGVGEKLLYLVGSNSLGNSTLETVGNYSMIRSHLKVPGFLINYCPVAPVSVPSVQLGSCAPASFSPQLLIMIVRTVPHSHPEHVTGGRPAANKITKNSDDKLIVFRIDPLLSFTLLHCMFG